MPHQTGCLYQQLRQSAQASALSVFHIIADRAQNMFPFLYLRSK